MVFKSPNPKAFTLLELIIVLAILAILASMAVAKFVDLKRRSWDVQERTTIESLRTAVLLYKARYDVWPDGNPAEWTPFSLLENPPPFLLGHPPYDPDGIHWYLNRDSGSDGLHWDIFCPHCGWNNCAGMGISAEYYYANDPTYGFSAGTVRYGYSPFNAHRNW